MASPWKSPGGKFEYTLPVTSCQEINGVEPGCKYVPIPAKQGSGKGDNDQGHKQRSTHQGEYTELYQHGHLVSENEVEAQTITDQGQNMLVQNAS